MNRRGKVCSEEYFHDDDLINLNTRVIVERVPIEFAEISSHNRPFMSQLDHYARANLSAQNETLAARSQPQVTSAHDDITRGLTGPATGARPTAHPQNLPTASSIPHQTATLSDAFRPTPKPDQSLQDAIPPIFSEEEWLIALDKAKYIIIKSSNIDNIMLSRKHSEWATTKANQTSLQFAFTNTDFVFLIFTVSRTKSFQGVALMTSGILNKVADYWVTSETIRLGGCFKIQWITNWQLPFGRADQLKNVENEPVTMSKDCTEVDRETGKQLCLMFHLPFREPHLQCPLSANFTKAFVTTVQAKGEEKQAEKVMKSIEVDRRKTGERGGGEREHSGEAGEKEALLRALQGNQDPLVEKVLQMLAKQERVSGDKLRRILGILGGEEDRGEEQQRERARAAREAERRAERDREADRKQRKPAEETVFQTPKAKPIEPENRHKKIAKTDQKDAQKDLRYHSDDDSASDRSGPSDHSSEHQKDRRRNSDKKRHSDRRRGDRHKSDRRHNRR